MFKPIIPTQDITLPSNGLLYDGKYKNLTIRAITGREEMYLNSSTPTKAIDRVIKSCTTTSDGTNIDVNELCTPDKLYLLLMIRSVTYGGLLNVRYTCDECKSEQVGQIDIDNLPITELTTDMLEDMSFKLPDSKIDIKLRILSEHDTSELETKSNTIANKIGANPKEYLFISRLMAFISEMTYTDEEKGEVTLTSEPKHRTQMQFILENITGNDIAVLQNKIAKLNDFGIQLYQDSKCNSCGHPVRLTVSLLNTEFFRPSTARQSE